MPTKKPRLTIALSRETYEAISGAAKVMGATKGGVISDVMDDVAPALAKLAAAKQAFDRATPKTRQAIEARFASFQTAMNGLEHGAAGMATAALSSLDLFLGEQGTGAQASVASGTGAVAAEGVKRAKQAPEPPPPNRGVGTGQGKGKVTSIRGGRRV